MDVNDIKLLPHNQITYDKIQEAWKNSNKVAAIQATGTGKSYLILKCLYNEPDKNKIVLAPSNYILEQIQNEVDEELPNTILMTYSKLSFISNEEIQSLNLSMIIMDEFHRCGAESWGDGIQKLLNNFPNAKILGTSATNIRFLDDNRDMAKELFDGNIVNNLSLVDAIVEKILPMPKYISALYTFDDEIENLKSRINNSKNTDKEKEELLKETDKMKNKLDKSKGIPQILKKYLDKNNDKFIIFCKNSKHLIEMKKVVIGWFKKTKIFKNINTYIAYSEYSNTDKEIESFISNKNKNTVKLLFSIDMFNEGIHIKDISGVILLRPTTSPIIYYQQIGRAIQVGKKDQSIIFDFVNNFNNIGANNFINDLKKSLKQQKEKNGNNTNQLDNFEFMIFDEMQEVKTLFEQLDDKLMDNWDEKYEQLREYKQRKGDCNVSRKDKEYNILGSWVDRQRVSYNKGLLSEDKIEKLEQINISWNILESNWNEMYQQLVEFKEKYDNFNILRKYDKTLYNWTLTQRLLYKKNDISQDRIKRLEKIDFEWNIIDSKWEQMYTKLIEYKNKIGNCNVPSRYKDKSLGRWISGQRKLYKKHLLSEDKIKRLEKIGFKWNPLDEQWNINYNKLIEYKSKVGNCDVSVYDKENKSLGMWVRKQRTLYKENLLLEKRIKKLEKIGFKWNIDKNKSGINGTFFNKKTKKWVAYISVNKKQIRLGQNFKTKIGAIKARRDAELKYYGKSDINLDDYSFNNLKTNI